LSSVQLGFHFRTPCRRVPPGKHAQLRRASLVGTTTNSGTTMTGSTLVQHERVRVSQEFHLISENWGFPVFAAHTTLCISEDWSGATRHCIASRCTRKPIS